MKVKFNNKKAEKDLESKGIMICEVRLPGCYTTGAKTTAVERILTCAHKLKRRFYPKDGKLLNDPNEYILTCMHCHDILEKDPELIIKTFERLRP